MKINKILILVIIFLNNYCIVQAQSFEKDWQWLKFAETTAGTQGAERKERAAESHEDGGGPGGRD